VPPMTNASLTVDGPAKASIASGALNSARQFGGVLGVPQCGFLVRGSCCSKVFYLASVVSPPSACGSILCRHQLQLMADCVRTLCLRIVCARFPPDCLPPRADRITKKG
jgi:hypothetical protein